MIRLPKNIALNDEQETVLYQTLESAIGEGEDTLAQVLGELPIEADFITSAEEYSNQVSAQKERLRVLQELLQMLK